MLVLLIIPWKITFQVKNAETQERMDQIGKDCVGSILVIGVVDTMLVSVVERTFCIGRGRKSNTSFSLLAILVLSGHICHNSGSRDIMNPCSSF